MTVQDNNVNGGADRTVDLSGLLIDISLSLARADTVEALHSVLNMAARRFAKLAQGAVSICELGMSAGGSPSMLWQSNTGGLSLQRDKEFFDWYERAARGASALPSGRVGRWRGSLSGRATADDVGIRVAVIIEAGKWDDGLSLYANGLADLAAAAAGRVREQKAAALEQRRVDNMLVATRAWLELGADVAWEASTEGIIRCRRVFNRRNDVGRAIDGLNMKSLDVGEDGRSLFDVLVQRGSVRQMRVHLPGGVPDRNIGSDFLYVSGRSLIEGDDTTYAGTFVAVGREQSRDEAREVAMLVQMRDARMREEQQRREAEAMLQGLRLLLGQVSSNDKMAQLIAVVCECIGASDACLVERGFDGKSRILVPPQRALRAGAHAAMDLVMNNASGRNVRVYSTEERDGSSVAAALGLEGGQISVLALPLRGEAAFLVCVTRRPGGFSSGDLDFAERFTLLLRQALLLREEQAQLAHSAKMAALGQMSASIAHELRQPLNTISLAVQNLEFLLEAPEVDGDAATKKVKRVLAQVDRASEVIDRMRRFGRKSTNENEMLVLRNVVENVEAIMHHVLLQNGVCLENNVPTDIEVYADQLQIEQVIGNLIQNAVDAVSGVGTRNTDVDGFIRISAAPSSAEEKMVVLRVEDNGPGFPAEIIDRVLKPFFTTKPTDRGTGLGLAICDAIVRESGGRIEVGNHETGGFVAIVLPRVAT